MPIGTDPISGCRPWSNWNFAFTDGLAKRTPDELFLETALPRVDRRGAVEHSPVPGERAPITMIIIIAAGERHSPQQVGTRMLLPAVRCRHWGPRSGRAGAKQLVVGG